MPNAARKNEDTRLFCPNWEKPPLFFLHIPKTAGSSNNSFLRGLYGAGNFQAHTENLLPDLTAGRMRALRLDCISGHIPLWAWHLYEGNRDYARVTLLRDPWERLVSHINWVNLFNHGVKMPRHGPGADSLEQAVKWIAHTDFTCRNSLRNFYDAINALPHFTSFDNYQTRMLRQGAMDAMEKRLTPQDLEAANSALSGFFHIGFCEDQERFQRELLDKLHLPHKPIPIITNTGRCKAVQNDNYLAREIFAPWIEYDQALVGYARGIKRG